MDYAKESLRLHGEWKGKIEVVTRVPAENKDDLSLAYTPGVAAAVSGDPERCKQILRSHQKMEYVSGRYRWFCDSWTWRHRTGSRHACYGR